MNIKFSTFAIASTILAALIASSLCRAYAAAPAVPAPTAPLAAAVPPPADPAEPPPPFGSPLFDAGALARALAVNDDATVAKIFKAYGIKTNQDVVSNPFLKPLNLDTTVFTRASVTVEPAVSKSGGAGTGFALLDSTTAIDALAGFLVNRVKQTAEVMLLQDVKKDFADSRFRLHLDPIFPRTSALLAMATPATDRLFIGTLQADLKADLADVPDNLPAFFRSFEFDPDHLTNAHAALLATYDTNKDKTLDAGELAKLKTALAPAIDLRHRAIYLLSAGTTIATDLSLKGRTPYHILDHVREVGKAYPFRASPSVEPIQRTLTAATIVSHMLRGKSDANNWCQRADLVGILGQPQTPADGGRIVQIMLGLSYALDSTLYTEVGFNDQAAANVIANLSSFLSFADAVIQHCEVIAKEYDAIAQVVLRNRMATPDKKIKLSSGNFSQLIREIGELTKSLDQVGGFFPAITLPIDQAVADRVTRDLILVNETIWAVREPNYPVAITDCSLLVTEALTLIDSDKNQDPFLEFLTANGPLIAALCEAKTADDFTKVLDNAALPVGSYIGKQTAETTISINGYVGGAVGWESLMGDLNNTTAKRGRFHAAITAPVGVAFTRKCNHFGFGAVSAFVPIVDLGAVTSYRFGGESKQLPPTTWSNVLAPGFYVVGEFKNSPLCLNFGGQYGPALRKVDATNGNTVERAAWQVNLALTVDIPIFNLHVRRTAK